jgi:hypothetical protein
MIATWVRTLFPPLGILTFFNPLHTVRYVPAAITLCRDGIVPLANSPAEAAA